ncbi:hypothetical protein B9Z55_018066 [Caenorhabditis nigoni]|uniref:Serpentine receptor class gamma n=1 Tax=Caenorhabditis nigoni TaxID=1611254 RepID=A0A2G5TD18_9PELO|nr:hypothetical protein B9Z55_018066 [Caenorhabditis nigoni]
MYPEFSVKYFLCAVCYIIKLIVLGITAARLAFEKLTTSVNQEVSKKLTKIALTSGYVYSGIMIFMLANFLAPQIPNFPVALHEIATSLMTTVSDLMTLSMPYILLIFDTNIEKDIRLSRERFNVNPTGPSVS